MKAGLQPVVGCCSGSCHFIEVVTLPFYRSNFLYRMHVKGRTGTTVLYVLAFNTDFIGKGS